MIYKKFVFSLTLFTFLAATNVFAEVAQDAQSRPRLVTSAPMVVEMVIASIDGEPVTVSDIKEFMTTGGEKPLENIPAGGPEVRKVLQDYIMSRLLEREAAKAGINVSDEAIDAYIEEIQRQNNVDEAGFRKLLSGQGITLEEYKMQVRSDILRTRVISARVRSKVSIVDEDIDRYLDAHPQLKPEEGSMHVIQFTVPKEIEGGRERIEKIRTAAMPSAKWSDIDPLAYLDLGHVKAEELRDELRAALKETPVNGVSQVIETETAYILVGNRGVATAEQLLDDATRNQIREELYTEEVNKRLDLYAREDLPKNYDIEIKLKDGLQR